MSVYYIYIIVRRDVYVAFLIPILIKEFPFIIVYK